MKASFSRFFLTVSFALLAVLVSACGVELKLMGMKEAASVSGTTHTLSMDLLAGVGDPGGPGADGIGSTARFRSASGAATDGVNLYVTDCSNSNIRKVVIATGETSTIAGVAGAIGYSNSTDGTGATAKFYCPMGIVTDGTNLYVADEWNNKIRKVVIATGNTTTLAGNVGYTLQDSTDGTGATASFNWPTGIATDGTNLYIADYLNNAIRQVVIATGDTTTIAGAGQFSSGSSDGTGSGALFWHPWGVATDGTNVYVTDMLNDTIRKVVIASGVTTTLSGQVGTATSVDGTGDPAGTARFYGPSAIVLDGSTLYVADASNTVREVATATGNTSTLSGFTSSDIGGFVVNGTNLYVPSAETIVQVALATGVSTTIAGTQAMGFSNSTDGTGTTARFYGLGGMVSDGTNLYVADSGNEIIRKVVIATGDTSTIAGVAGVAGSSDSTDGTGATAEFISPTGIATDGMNLYVADGPGAIRKVVIATGDTTTLPNGYATGITTDGVNLYTVSAGNDVIYKVVIATGVATILAGDLGVTGSSDSTDGTGATARFFNPFGIATDGVNLYVADTYNNAIRKVVIATGETTTLASVTTPIAITTDGTSIYFTGYGSTTIQMINLTTLVQSTYLGPGGMVNVSANLMPLGGANTEEWLLFTNQGFFFGNGYSAIYEIH